MEANLFIKSYKAEGKKIKDLQFYGDMEIDIGGGPVAVEYEYVGDVTSPLLPFGVTWEKNKPDSNHLEVKFVNASDKTYILSARQTVGKNYELGPGSELVLSYNTWREVSQYYYYLFSEDLKVLTGYISDF